MPYVQRDAKNKIIATGSHPENVGNSYEFLPNSHPDVADFRASQLPPIRPAKKEVPALKANENSLPVIRDKLNELIAELKAQGIIE